MKILRFMSPIGSQYGILENDKVVPMLGNPFDGLTIDTDADLLSLEQVELLSPVQPGKIIAIGLNYADHAAETNKEIPDDPLMFLLSPTAVVPHNQPILLPTLDQRIDYEGELVVVIKKEAREIQETEAHDYILGYTIGNDVSNRHLQKKDGQFTRAKSFHTFKPLGPIIVTNIAPDNLNIQTRLNGEVRQSSNTSSMIFSIPRLIQDISKVMTLFPGDVIYTGTPSGIGKLSPGDIVEIEIEGIGVLKNPISAKITAKGSQ